MDGLQKHSEKVFILAATNVPCKQIHTRISLFIFPNSNIPLGDIDPAFLRRLEKRVYVQLPSIQGRRQIFQTRLEKIGPMVLLDKDVDLTALAHMSEGYSASDIDIVCKEACKWLNNSIHTLLNKNELFRHETHQISHYQTRRNGSQGLPASQIRNADNVSSGWNFARHKTNYPSNSHFKIREMARQLWKSIIINRKILWFIDRVRLKQKTVVYMESFDIQSPCKLPYPNM